VEEYYVFAYWRRSCSTGKKYNCHIGYGNYDYIQGYKNFLAIAEEEGFIQTVSSDIPKSFIITETDKKSIIYLSPISSVTLQSV